MQTSSVLRRQGHCCLLDANCLESTFSWVLLDRGRDRLEREGRGIISQRGGGRGIINQRGGGRVEGGAGGRGSGKGRIEPETGAGVRYG